MRVGLRGLVHNPLAQGAAAIRHRRTQRNWKPQRVDGIVDGLILFDGVCLLCSRSVRFVLERDPAARFRFAPIESAYGTALATRLGITAGTPETNAAIIGGWAYFKSDAAIQVLARLPRWSWARWLRVVPRPLRNWLYDLTARNRYRVFGRTEQCFVPTPDVAARFVGDGIAPTG
ncbi:MAG: DUF393 domain-containing protein [Alphaproteobacteria bacterium]|nr:DUF393 domain-containing protein [Alphaproteobacteria bacterium]